MITRILSTSYDCCHAKRSRMRPASFAAVFFVASFSCVRRRLWLESSSSIATSGSNDTGWQRIQSKCFCDIRRKSPLYRFCGWITSATRTLGKMGTSGTACFRTAKNVFSAGVRRLWAFRYRGAGDDGGVSAKLFCGLGFSFFASLAPMAISKAAISSGIKAVVIKLVSCCICHVGPWMAPVWFMLTFLLLRGLRSVKGMTVWETQDARRVLCFSFWTRFSSSLMGGEPCPYHHAAIAERYCALVMPRAFPRFSISVRMWSGTVALICGLRSTF